MEYNNTLIFKKDLTDNALLYLVENSFKSLVVAHIEHKEKQEKNKNERERLEKIENEEEEKANSDEIMSKKLREEMCEINDKMEKVKKQIKKLENEKYMTVWNRKSLQEKNAELYSLFSQMKLRHWALIEYQNTGKLPNPEKIEGEKEGLEFTMRTLNEVEEFLNE